MYSVEQLRTGTRRNSGHSPYSKCQHGLSKGSPRWIRGCRHLLVKRGTSAKRARYVVDSAMVNIMCTVVTCVVPNMASDQGRNPRGISFDRDFSICNPSFVTICQVWQLAQVCFLRATHERDVFFFFSFLMWVVFIAMYASGLRLSLTQFRSFSYILSLQTFPSPLTPSPVQGSKVDVHG